MTAPLTKAPPFAVIGAQPHCQTRGSKGCICRRALQVPAHGGPVQLQLPSDAGTRPPVARQRKNRLIDCCIFTLGWFIGPVCRPGTTARNESVHRKVAAFESTRSGYF